MKPKPQTLLTIPTLPRQLLKMISMALLFAWANHGQAQLVFTSGSLNYYYTDGFSFHSGSDPYSPTAETVSGPGTPLSSTGQAWLGGGAGTPAASPGSVYSANTPYTYSSGSASAYGSAVINWSPASLASGGTNFGNGSFAGTGITLVNNSSSIAEARLDWVANYVNLSPNTFYLPISIYMNFAGSYATGGFAAVAGQMTFTDINSTPSTGTATIPVNPYASGWPGGDWTSYSGYPAGLNPAGTFFGYDLPTSTPYYAYLGSFSSTSLTVGPYDTVTASGFLDVFVDPGTVSVVLQAGPHLGITTVDHKPVVYWPSALTGFVLESKTSATSGAWMTNTSPITTINGTNTVTIDPNGVSQYFRLIGPSYSN